MSEYGPTSHGSHPKHRGGPISVPWVLLAGLLIGTGLLVMAYLLYSFNVAYLGGSLLVVAGSLMLFSPRAGADRA